MSDKTTWPSDFPDIGGKEFDWVFVNRAEFVHFTLNDMQEPTGFFKIWKNYCSKKENRNDISDRRSGRRTIEGPRKEDSERTDCKC